MSWSMILTRICSWLRHWASAGTRQRQTGGRADIVIPSTEAPLVGRIEGLRGREQVNRVIATLTTIEGKRHYSGPPGGYSEKYNPTLGLWEKRNTSSGKFEAIRKSGNVFKGVKREN